MPEKLIAEQTVVKAIQAIIAFCHHHKESNLGTSEIARLAIAFREGGKFEIKFDSPRFSRICIIPQDEHRRVAIVHDLDGEQDYELTREINGVIFRKTGAVLGLPNHRY